MHAQGFKENERQNVQRLPNILKKERYAKKQKRKRNSIVKHRQREQYIIITNKKGTAKRRDRMTFNKWIGIGTVTNNPEEIHLPNGTIVLKFKLAIDRNETKKDYIPIEIYGKLIRTAKKCITKGAKVLIEGKLYIDQWKSENREKEAIKIKAYNFKILEWGEDFDKENEIFYYPDWYY